MTWSRSGAGDDELRMEAAQCRVTAMSGSSGQRDGTMAYVMASSIYRDCMLGKGWIQTGQR